jgi:hypothetical protein
VFGFGREWRDADDPTVAFLSVPTDVACATRDLVPALISTNSRVLSVTAGPVSQS